MLSKCHNSDNNNNNPQYQEDRNGKTKEIEKYLEAQQGDLYIPLLSPQKE